MSKGQLPTISPPVGVVVVTHDSAAERLCCAATTFVGEVPAMTSVSCVVGESMPAIAQKILAATESVDKGAGVLFLVDLHGSTPFNAAMTMLDGTRDAEVLCGVNLPMLMKVSTLDRRSMTPLELAETLRDIGQRSIRIGTEITGKVDLEGRRHT